MKFYKIAKPDGWDFYTGHTINYRENIGKSVSCPDYDRNGKLCSNAFLHASRNPNQCFVGGSIPCSIFEVSGKSIREESDKAGFKNLKVVKELNPEKVFDWNYKEACNPFNPFSKNRRKVYKKEIELLKQWDSVRDSVWNSVWYSGWASVRDSVGDLVRASVRNSVRTLVWNSIEVSIENSVGRSIRESVRNSVWAYIGYIFKDCIDNWRFIDHNKNEYPYQSVVDLWNRGVVPSYDGKIWRLHGGKNAKILWQGKINQGEQQ